MNKTDEQIVSKHNFIQGHCEICGQWHMIQDIVFMTDDLDMITLSVCQQCNKKFVSKNERMM